MTSKEYKEYKATERKATEKAERKFSVLTDVQPVNEKAARKGSETLPVFDWAAFFAPIDNGTFGLYRSFKRGQNARTPNAEYYMTFGSPTGLRLLTAQPTGCAIFKISDYHAGQKHDKSVGRSDQPTDRPNEGETPFQFLRRMILSNEKSIKGVLTAYRRYFQTTEKNDRRRYTIAYLTGETDTPPANRSIK